MNVDTLTAAPSPKLPQASRRVLAACVLGFVVFAASWLSLNYTRFDGGVSAVWTANGFLLGALLLTPRSAWRPWFIAAGVGQVLARVLHDDPWLAVVGLAAANLLECAIVGFWVTRNGTDLAKARSLGSVARAALLATLLACAISGAIAVPIVLSHASVSPGLTWLIWYGAHVLGLVIVATLMVCAFQPQVRLIPVDEAEGLDFAICVLLQLVVSWVAFSLPYPVLFVVFLPLLLLAWRHGLSGMIVGVLALAISSALPAARGAGPFGLVHALHPSTRLLLWQLYVACACLLAYGSAVTLTQRRHLETRLTRSEARFRVLAENSQDLIVRRLESGERAYVSPASLAMLGYPPEQLPPMDELVHPNDRERVFALFRDMFRGEMETTTVGYRVRHRDGHYVWVDVAMRRIESEEGPQLVYSARDVSERVRAQQEQAAIQAQLRAITDHLPAMVARFDREARYTYANTRSRAMVPGQQIIGKTLLELRGPEHYAEFAPHIEAVLRGEPQQFDTWLDAAEGRTELRTQFVPDIDGAGVVQGFYSVSFDITEAKRLERELEKLARFDPLTGMANRREFDERLQAAVARASRTGAPLMLLALDLDRFKNINDTLGHAAGDEVLKEFARRVRSSVYDVDLVARLGGDEFLVLVQYSPTRESGERIARNILEAMRPPIDLPGGESVQAATSIGIGLQQPVASAQELLAAADRALYAAKAKGRNTYSF